MKASFCSPMPRSILAPGRSLRGEFPNPKHGVAAWHVRPGADRRGHRPRCVAVPQQAVRRNDAGVSEIYFVARTTAPMRRSGSAAWTRTNGMFSTA